ncbi:hypothetical protein Q9290_05910 [Oceanimonas sp. CHS3-5]|uniref:hypothetical protein n=1 Tax=Oceanimonas sp. CHS3-5 TaxID=3068186 RepID=UPI00273E611C|nr:hypothetical protein [Oceanimonas sp. CHS3-5]MDP5291824.1 hypothetical protein [Oceanimonas sp. CHS3-5]
MVKQGIALSDLLFSLFSVLSAHAIEIRNTKDRQSAKYTYDGMTVLGFNELLNDARTGNYNDLVEFKRTRLHPMIRTYSERFPLTLYPVDEMRNNMRAVMTVKHRFYHLIRQQPDGSPQQEQTQSAFQYQLDMISHVPD